MDGGIHFENVILVFGVRQAFTFSTKPVVLSLVILPPRGYSTVSGNVVCAAENAAGIQWAEAKDVAMHPGHKMHRTQVACHKDCQ